MTDATLIYWAIISPRIQEALDSVGMTENEYVTAMRRLLAHGLLGADTTTDGQPNRERLGTPGARTSTDCLDESVELVC